MSEGLTLPDGDEIARVAQLIEDRGIHTIRVSLCDLHGIARGRPVPARAFLDGVARDGMFMTNFLLTIDTGVGIAPVVELEGAGVPVGLGVDGSSNSDTSSVWLEARMVMIANRFRAGPRRVPQHPRAGRGGRRSPSWRPAPRVGRCRRTESRSSRPYRSR